MGDDRKKNEIKWYLKKGWIIAALLCVGPLALPLVWMSPALNKTHKILITIIVIPLTIWFMKASYDVYNILLQEIKEIQRVLTM